MHTNTMEVEIYKIRDELTDIRYQLKVIKELAVNQQVEIDRLSVELESARGELIDIQNQKESA